MGIEKNLHQFDTKVTNVRKNHDLRKKTSDVCRGLKLHPDLLKQDRILTQIKQSSVAMSVT